MNYCYHIFIILLTLTATVSANTFYGKWIFDKSKSWNTEEAKVIATQDKGHKQLLIYFSVMEKMSLEINKTTMKTTLKSTKDQKETNDTYIILKKVENQYHLKLVNKKITRYAILTQLDKKTIQFDLNMNKDFKKQIKSPPLILNLK